MSPKLGSILLSVLLVLSLSPVHAQTIDYDLNQAMRTIKDVDNGLKRLRTGDVATYNRLSAKLAKAAKHLQATKSKPGKDFQGSVKRWRELRANMAAIAKQWQSAQRQSQPAAATTVPTPARPAPRAKKAAVAPVNLDPLMNKYRRNNLPKLSDTASADEARVWAEHLKALQTSTLQKDLATIAAARKSQAATKSDADRVSRWISGTFQGNIKREVQARVQKPDGTITSMMHLAKLIMDVDSGDLNGAYRFAGGDKFKNNKLRLDNAIRAGAVAKVFDQVFGTADPERAGKLASIEAARKRLGELKPLADKQAKVFAKLPKKVRKKNKDFLAPIAQEYWMNGSVLAQSDVKGNIWVNGNDVGDITHNGAIWVQSNERGSIEPNGAVWFDGNEVGSLEPNGEVWRAGNQVGLIDKKGKVWINGSAAGEIVPFNGEWRRAAILFYFRDLFR